MENQEQKPKKKFYKLWWFWAVAVVVGFIIIGASSSSTPQKVGESGGAQQAEQTFKTGDEVLVGKTVWKIITAKDLGSVLASNNPFIDSKRTSGRYIKVTFEVKNVGDTLQSVGNTQLVDSQGRKYTAASGVSFFIPNEEQLFILDNINPGITKRYTEVYDIPKDATGLRFRPGGAVVLKDVYIDLGL